MGSWSSRLIFSIGLNGLEGGHVSYDDMWLAVAAGGAIGCLLGVLAALLWRAKREHGLRIEVELLRVRVKAEESLGIERDQALARARDQLQAAFGELARDSLKSNSEVFLQLARERLLRQQHDAAAALKERETAIESMVQPIRDALAKTEAQIQSIERDRIESLATIKSQMEMLASGQTQLSRETRNLVTALRRPDVRGQWGEITLKRLAELAGMSAHVDFTEQRHQPTESGPIRPDMIVHLPEHRDIVVDVKTPLDAYLAAVEAQSDEERDAALKRHAQLVSARVRELASKHYWSQFDLSPDFVVLFLPGEQFLSAALQKNPALIDESLQQNVMLATPTSLVALLKAIAYGWKQTVLADNAAEIRRLGEDLYKRLAVFGEHLGKLGRSLGNSVDSFNKAVGSLEQQVLPAARRFPELGLRVIRDMEPIERVATLVRAPRVAGTVQFDVGADETPTEAS
jgi:DNA recombination protein RmuC